MTTANVEMGFPYTLYKADRGGDNRAMESFTSLEQALRRRDEKRKTSDHRRVFWHVVDDDDQENGDAEWCVNCEEHGTFHHSLECEECR